MNFRKALRRALFGQLIQAANGKLVSVTFVRKDGTLRTLNGRLGVRSALADPSSPQRSSVAGRPDYLVLYDVHKRGYRSVCLDRVLSLRSCGFRVEGPALDEAQSVCDRPESVEA